MMNSRIVNQDFQLVATGAFKSSMGDNQTSLTGLYGKVPVNTCYIKVQSEGPFSYSMDGSQPGDTGFMANANETIIVPIQGAKKFIIQDGVAIKIQPLAEIG